jgi:hypothetical protein
MPQTLPAPRELLFGSRYNRAMNTDKPVHATNVPTPTHPPRRQFLHEEIARRAEQIWNDRNRPTGSDEPIWFEAENQLQAEAESRPVSGTESRPYVSEPARPVRSQTKGRDPSDAAAQTRSPTESKSKQSAGKIRNQ